jgi:glycerate kinase
MGVAEAAATHAVPTVAVCGRATLTREQAQAAGIEAVHALTDLEPDVARCIANAGELLERLAERVAAERFAPQHDRVDS